MEEQELLRKAQQGDREAFGRLVYLYQDRLRAYAARYVDRSEEVFDIVQDAFLDAFTHLGSFDPRQEFGPWLRAICRNRVLNFFRTRKARRAAALTLVDEALREKSGLMEDDLEAAADRVKALAQCVDTLAQPQRELVALRYGQNLPLAELGVRVKRSAAALSMTLSRIRSALMKCMERRLSGAGP